MKNINQPKHHTPWRRNLDSPSLPGSFCSINIPAQAGFWRKIFCFFGPGLMVAVGYMDPGNWATDLAGGAKFGYTLLSVILLSSFMAMFLQYLALKLGIATGRDLAQACRDHYSKPTVIFLWILAEIAIVACDLAEVIGSAIALNLLFKIPLTVGVFITALDVLIVLSLQNKGFRIIESLVVGLIVLIGGCFAYELAVSHPAWSLLAGNLLPKPCIVTNPTMLYISIGIIGATVMPHNLYLHSSIVQTRAFKRDDEGKAMAIRYATLDSNFALLCAFFINASILVLSAAVFHGTSHSNVADINDAYRLLAPALGLPLASFFFAVALLASGQSSSLTGTLAGQIVMNGFFDLRLRPWISRLMSRLAAIIPAFIVVVIMGQQGMGKLLILSQVILSLQLAFAVVPLVIFTNDPVKMGRFVNSWWIKMLAWAITAAIIFLNCYLLIQTVFPAKK